MLAPQLLIHRYAFHGILRRKRATSDEKTRVSLACVTRNAAPKQMQQIEVAMRRVHAGAAKLDHFAAKRFVRSEIKFPLAVIAEVRRCKLTGLQPVRADNLACRHMLNDQMIAKLVERIDIETSRVRFGQPFAELEIENLKPQPLGEKHFVRVLRQSRHVLRAPGSRCLGR